MAFGESIWVPDLATRIEQRIAQQAGIPADSVFLSFEKLEELAKNPPAERFISIMPLSMPVAGPLVAGAGAQFTGFDSVWQVAAFSRLNTDKQHRNANFIKDQARGLAMLVHGVVGALQLSPLASQAGVSPLREPMRLVDIVWVGNSPTSGYGWAVTKWSVKFHTNFEGPMG